jgi:hypothetical protein
MARGRVQIVEPERQLVRKVTPFAPVALIVAFAIGALVSGLGAGVSAAIGIVIVYVNVAANAWIVSTAARISMTALFGAVMGGFIVRLAIILGIMFWLNTFAFFSPIAFGLAVIPATLLLIGYEMKLVSGPLGQQWNLPEGPTA